MTSELDPLLGRTLRGRYRIVRALGRGGAGAVYEGEQLDLSRAVAIKTLRPELATDHEVLERFRREAKVAASLDNPHVVRVLDWADAERDAPAFMVLELVRGESLLDRLRREPRLGMRESVGLVMQTLSALESAHRAGIVHRDLKPGNVMLTEVPGLGQTVKLLDFGIARVKESEVFQRLTRTGAVLGTPRYMAPEQLRGEAIDPRADLWAVGVVLFRMVTGAVPFDGPPDRLVRAILLEPPAPLPQGVPASLAAVILRALAKRPEDRWPSAGEMLQALAAVQDELSRPSLSGWEDSVAMTRPGRVSGSHSLPASGRASGSHSLPPASGRASGSHSLPPASGRASGSHALPPAPTEGAPAGTFTSIPPGPSMPAPAPTASTRLLFAAIALASLGVLGVGMFVLAFAWISHAPAAAVSAAPPPAFVPTPTIAAPPPVVPALPSAGARRTWDDLVAEGRVEALAVDPAAVLDTVYLMGVADDGTIDVSRASPATLLFRGPSAGCHALISPADMPRAGAPACQGLGELPPIDLPAVIARARSVCPRLSAPLIVSLRGGPRIGLTIASDGGSLSGALEPSGEIVPIVALAPMCF